MGKRREQNAWHAVDAQFTGRVVLHDNPRVSGVLLHGLWGLPCMLSVCLDLFSFLLYKLFEGRDILLH